MLSAGNGVSAVYLTAGRGDPFPFTAGLQMVDVVGGLHDQRCAGPDSAARRPRSEAPAAERP
jgi:hypothetical protein